MQQTNCVLRCSSCTDGEWSVGGGLGSWLRASPTIGTSHPLIERTSAIVVIRLTTIYCPAVPGTKLRERVQGLRRRGELLQVRLCLTV